MSDRAARERSERSDEVAHVLAERARALAAPVASEAATERHLRVRAGDLEVLVPARRAQYVQRAGALALAPGSRPAVGGLAAVLGQVVPVVPLSTLLHIDPPRSASAPLLLVVDDDGDALGLLVDSVDGVVDLEAGDAARRAPGLGRLLRESSSPGQPPVLDLDALLANARLFETIPPEQGDR